MMTPSRPKHAPKHEPRQDRLNRPQNSAGHAHTLKTRETSTAMSALLATLAAAGLAAGMATGLTSVGAPFLPEALQSASGLGLAHAQQPTRLSRHHAPGEFTVPLHKSGVLETNRPFAEIAVGNPEIADVVALTSSSLYVLGRAHGTTNLSLIDSNGDIIAVVDVSVTHDIETLKAKLFQLLPDEAIEVRAAGDAIVLSGQVSSTVAMQQALGLAEHYAPGNVSNMMTVAGSQQVLLQVRFAEVQRNTLKQLGTNLSVLGVDGNDVYTGTSGIGASATAFASAVADIVTGSYRLEFLIDALEQKGLVRTLSEPNIIALSGDQASFLAGGEIPIPVPQTGTNSDAITIQYKPFGVGLSFTPTVLGRETINLELATEVSSIDTSVSIETNGLSIPGLKVRRAETTVELKDGQSFAIAGLIQDNFQDTVRQLPGFADLPLLGALARSADYRRDQTELVVFITVHLVQPAAPGDIAEPVDTAVPPTEFELFLLGRTEGHASVTKAAGISGEYGYILP